MNELKTAGKTDSMENTFQPSLECRKLPTRKFIHHLLSLTVCFAFGTGDTNRNRGGSHINDIIALGPGCSPTMHSGTESPHRDQPIAHNAVEGKGRASGKGRREREDIATDPTDQPDRPTKFPLH
ncbi:hypothetical protein JZ751_011689 [Albula glossodonta]|uniref:Uncharacterized protein n=1 Tax=Albula glossodonta TaxID=121402 RepID=A0A8T2PQC6_9TELE|nr:hypothetical protein JZ751_011689 [Albula glossodonta]